MLACLDVDYRPTCVVTACVSFASWTDATPAASVAFRSEGAAEAYVPGQFFRRELPYLVDALARLAQLPEVILVDGYVWLGPGEPGLGAHLHEALARRAAVVGVAKRPYRGASMDASMSASTSASMRSSISASVTRGGSATPLHVTSVGLDLATAVANVASMHGPHRVPTLLKLVDRLSRDAQPG
jgi:deoxyribonuclease V